MTGGGHPIERPGAANRVPVVDRRLRKLISVIIGVFAFVGAYLFLFPTGCADVDGMSSWERCTTVMGNPAFSVAEELGIANQFDIAIPLAVGVLAGAVTSWLLRLRITDRQ
jgi:hypothetical protein